LLDFHRPRAGELPADEAAELERHLAGCPECEAADRTERRLDEHFGRAVRDVPVPAQLRERLLGRLKEERAAALRRKLAWTARGFIVAAAAALVGAFILWQVYLKPPKPDLNELNQAQLDKQNSRTPQDVQLWFQQHHNVDMVAPKEFDYGNLIDCDLVTLQGKRVPELVFQRVENSMTRARVFVLDRDQFDIDALPRDVSQFDSAGQRMKVIQEPPNTAYVVIYNGDDLDPLLIPLIGR
jgi:hypothetical protein